MKEDKEYYVERIKLLNKEQENQEKKFKELMQKGLLVVIMVKDRATCTHK